MRFIQLILSLLLVIGCGRLHVVEGGAVAAEDATVPTDADVGATDGAIDEPDAAIEEPDAEPPVGDGGMGHDGVRCGDMTCLGGDECFHEAGWEGGHVTPRCVPPDFRTGPAYEMREGWVILGCDGPEDCAEALVCAVWPGSYGSWTMCSETAIAGEELCHASADCRRGSVCRPGAYLPELYGVCQPPDP